MKIHHIYHSGFCVEFEHMVLLFDWYTGSLPAFDAEKELYVFVSHRHPDHYSPKIWELAQTHPHIHFILHKGICKKPPLEALLVQADAAYEIGPVHVETLLSTDEGVAYLVLAEGKTIFHAGDLNLWYWEGEPEADNRWQTGTYHAEINKLEGRHIDVAFLTLDPRQEAHATFGMEYFLRHTHTDCAIPMHYWEERKKAMAYLDTPQLSAFNHQIHFEEELTL